MSAFASRRPRLRLHASRLALSLGRTRTRVHPRPRPSFRARLTTCVCRDSIFPVLASRLAPGGVHASLEVRAPMHTHAAHAHAPLSTPLFHARAPRHTRKILSRLHSLHSFTASQLHACPSTDFMNHHVDLEHFGFFEARRPNERNLSKGYGFVPPSQVQSGPGTARHGPGTVQSRSPIVTFLICHSSTAPQLHSSTAPQLHPRLHRRRATWVLKKKRIVGRACTARNLHPELCTLRRIRVCAAAALFRSA